MIIPCIIQSLLLSCCLEPRRLRRLRPAMVVTKERGRCDGHLPHSPSFLITHASHKSCLSSFQHHFLLFLSSILSQALGIVPGPQIHLTVRSSRSSPGCTPRGFKFNTSPGPLPPSSSRATVFQHSIRTFVVLHPITLDSGLNGSALQSLRADIYLTASL